MKTAQHTIFFYITSWYDSTWCDTNRKRL